MLGFTEEEITSSFQLLQLAKEQLGGENVNEKDTEEWIDVNNKEPVFKILSGEKIVK